MRCRDDLIARSNASRKQGQEQGARSRADADSVSGPAVGGELLLERLDLRTENETRPIQYPGDRLVDLLLDPTVLCLQIDQWDSRRRVSQANLRAVAGRRRRGARHRPPQAREPRRARWQPR